MTSNIGTVDRIVRFVAGIILSAFYFTGVVAGIAGVAALIAGALLILTAAVRFCPVYRIFGACKCSR